MSMTTSEFSKKPLPDLPTQWSMPRTSPVPSPSGLKPLLLDQEPGSQGLLSRHAFEQPSTKFQPPRQKRAKAKFSRILIFLSGRSTIRLLTIIFHVVLLLLHITLLIAYLTGLEKRIMSPDSNDTTRFTTIINSASQVFIIAYSTFLLFLTQKLSLWKTLSTKQTLTTSHDSVSAWNGLGAAITTLYRQISIPSTVHLTIAVVAYLTGLSVLHITTPSLFGMQVVNITMPFQSSAYGYSDIDALAWSDVMTALGPYTQLPAESLVAINAINTLSTLEGLWSSTIYDQAQTLGAAGPVIYGNTVAINDVYTDMNANVGALSLNVTCGYLENVTASLKPLDIAFKRTDTTEALPISQEDPNPREYYISLDWNYENYSCQFAVPMPSLLVKGTNIDGNTFSTPTIYHLNPSCGDYVPAASAIFASAVVFQSFYPSNNPPANNASNSLIINGSVIPIPGIEDVLSQNQSYKGPVAFQLSGCSLSYEKYNTTVYSTPISGKSEFVILERDMANREYPLDTWSAWKPQFREHNTAHDQEVPLLEAWSQIFSFSGLRDWINRNNTTNISCKKLSANTPAYCGLKDMPVQEQSIMDWLGVDPTLKMVASKLGFEIALAEMAAAFFWYTITILISIDSGILSHVLNKNVSGVTVGQVSQLRLNLLPVIGGLCASFLLVMVVVFFARDIPRPASSSVESLDLLQIIWIVKQRPELFDAIGNIEVPSTEKLRENGMIPILLAGSGGRDDIEVGKETIPLHSRRSSHASDSYAET